MADVLVVDDDKMLCSMLLRRLESAGHNATCSHTLSDGCDLADKGEFDVVFLDVQLPDGNGLDYLGQFSHTRSRPEIIIMTGAGEPSGVKKAIKSGAWGYLEKPHVIRDLLVPLNRALEYRKEKSNHDRTKVVLKRDNIIGESSAITACLDQLAHTASTDASVLITGKTGTGKELFARAIHENSSRADKPFIIVDCASLPETLIESTLFGHVKGAFTGAERAEGGLIRLADSGTLFLDEIGELPFDVQKTFLRVVQEGRYRPVGSSTELYSDFRVVVATNRDLEQMTQTGEFRADLLFRLRSFHISLPSLDRRKEDIPALAKYIVSRLCQRLQIEEKELSSDFVAHLQAHSWLGNVRELYQLLEEVCARAYQHQTLFAKHLPEHIRISQALNKLEHKSPNHTNIKDQYSLANKLLPWKEHKVVMEKEYLIQLMTCANGNIQEACMISGISRARIYQLLKKQGIKP